MKVDTDKIKKLPVSDTTALLIACYRNCYELEDLFLDSMESLYGHDFATKLFEKECVEHFTAIRKSIGDYLLDSVADNISNNNLKSI